MTKFEYTGSSRNTKKMSEQKHNEEKLWINHQEKSLRAEIRLLKFKDKDTQQVICAVPSFDVSGYGANVSKAMEMLRFMIDDFCKYLLEMPQDDQEKTLSRLGWFKQTSTIHPSFSHAAIDEHGQLVGWNAEENSVEVEVLTL
jgi:hypothetical protein